jgi:deazaflavin-dependent oxidoreductase (nitroreductase family)
LGRRFLLLHHTGRRSGLARQTVLEVVGDRRGSPIVVSGFGPGSDWVRNLALEPRVEVDWGGRHFPAYATVVAETEAVEVLARYRSRHPWAAKALGKALGLSVADDPEAAAAALPVVRLEPIESTLA